MCHVRSVCLYHVHKVDFFSMIYLAFLFIEYISLQNKRDSQIYVYTQLDTRFHCMNRTHSKNIQLSQEMYHVSS